VTLWRWWHGSIVLVFVLAVLGVFVTLVLVVLDVFTASSVSASSARCTEFTGFFKYAPAGAASMKNPMNEATANAKVPLFQERIRFSICSIGSLWKVSIQPSIRGSSALLPGMRRGRCAMEWLPAARAAGGFHDDAQ
jgi:hypothetical protein